MNPILNEKLNALMEKFQQMEMFHELGDDESALETLKTISNEEIRILESLGKTFTDMANNIKHYQFGKGE